MQYRPAPRSDVPKPRSYLRALRSSLRLGLIPALLLSACSDDETALKVGSPDHPIAGQSSGGQSGGIEPGASGNLNQQGATIIQDYAVPQEELVLTPSSAMKVTGTIQVTGAEAGLLQIDVLPANAEGGMSNGVAPITVARFKSPGPYELLVPLKAEKVFLVLNLDLKGDGPDAADPRASYEKNPLVVRKDGATDINFVLDATQPQKDAPPVPPPGTDVGGAPGAGPAGAVPPGALPPGAAGLMGSGSGASPSTPAPTVQVPTVSSPGVVSPSTPVSPAAKSPTQPAAPAAPSNPSSPTVSAPTVKAPSLSAAPAPASAPLGEKPEVRPSTSGVKPGATDGRPIMDVLDESLDGAPVRAK